MCVSLDLSLYRSECVFPSMCETLSVLVCRVYLLVGGFVFVLCGFDIKVFLCVLGCDCVSVCVCLCVCVWLSVCVSVCVIILQ